MSRVFALIVSAVAMAHSNPVREAEAILRLNMYKNKSFSYTDRALSEIAGRGARSGPQLFQLTRVRSMESREEARATRANPRWARDGPGGDSPRRLA